MSSSCKATCASIVLRTPHWCQRLTKKKSFLAKLFSHVFRASWCSLLRSTSFAEYRAMTSSTLRRSSSLRHTASNVPLHEVRSRALLAWFRIAWPAASPEACSVMAARAAASSSESRVTFSCSPSISSSGSPAKRFSTLVMASSSSSSPSFSLPNPPAKKRAAPPVSTSLSTGTSTRKMTPAPTKRPMRFSLPPIPDPVKVPLPPPRRPSRAPACSANSVA
mmetsp:Transcript_102709/g.329242  ORF Transcript_102709/g.329242 Transcript_102709/m.329242 type:complete len:221 (+) Transcript_102709:1123-1785(+)